MGSRVDFFCHLYCVCGGIQNTHMHITHKYNKAEVIRLQSKIALTISVSPGVGHTQQVKDTFYDIKKHNVILRKQRDIKQHLEGTFS